MEAGKLGSVGALVILYLQSQHVLSRIVILMVCGFGFILSYTLGSIFSFGYLLPPLVLGIYTFFIHYSLQKLNLHKGPGNFFFIMLATLAINCQILSIRQSLLGSYFLYSGHAGNFHLACLEKGSPAHSWHFHRFSACLGVASISFTNHTCLYMHPNFTNNSWIFCGSKLWNCRHFHYHVDDLFGLTQFGTYPEFWLSDKNPFVGHITLKFDRSLWRMGIIPWKTSIFFKKQLKLYQSTGKNFNMITIFAE